MARNELTKEELRLFWKSIETAKENVSKWQDWKKKTLGYKNDKK